ncbi:MAG: TetR/AcrR family transcriptional regulator [Hyphomonadaceae bacterium]|nr:TetR/AcrR family transcriptional regulator [Hyphomonadaceae bacterium]
MSGARSAQTAPVRPNPARGITRLHAAQRVAYRNKIMAAATEIFVEKSYMATTVDDILARADVSRPTFYRYFSSKFDLAVSLIRSKGVESSAPFENFVTAGDVSAQAVRAMIRENMEFYERNSALVRVMTEVAASNPEYLAEVDAAFQRVARRLGAILPAFAARGPGGKRRSTRARLLLNQIAITSQLSVSEGERVDREAAVELLTEQFLAFCAAP